MKKNFTEPIDETAEEAYRRFIRWLRQHSTNDGGMNGGAK